MRVLVLGGSGFVGRAVLRELATLDPAHEVRVGGRGAPVGAAHGFRDVLVDVTDPEALAAACREVDAVLSLAHLIRGRREDLTSVNENGGAYLAAAAAAGRVGRVVRLSTTAVYGARLASLAGDLNQVVPESDVSRTRAAGDVHVLAGGGVVARAPLIHGPGDVWVLPTIQRVVRAVGWVEGGVARKSVVQVQALARVLVALTVGALEVPPGLCIVEEEVLSVRDLYGRYEQALLGETTGSSTLAEALSAGPQGDRAWVHAVKLLVREDVISTRGLTLQAPKDEVGANVWR